MNNDLIDELAKKCQNISPKLPDEIYFDYHRFAELIIQECVKEIKKEDGYHITFDTMDSPWDKGWSAGLKDAVDIIKEKFQVEE